MADNRILKKLLDRLFGSLINGPSLNCRPHSSRQRIDLCQFAKLNDETPECILRELLGPKRQVRISAKVPAPKGRAAAALASAIDEADDEQELTPDEKAAQQAFRDQQSVLSKLRSIADDSRTYENDTGVHVLQIGFPLLSLPPGSGGGLGSTRRILAPLAFISLSITIKGGPTPSVVLECRNDGADLIVPNVALLAWLESQTGQTIGELFNDETGEQPWVEIVSIAKRVCDLMQVPLPEIFGGETIPADFELLPAPRADDDGEAPKPSVISSAVIGLYPMTNQGLLRDMQALVAGEPAAGPIESFINVGISLEASPQAVAAESIVEKRTRSFALERLVTVADPCQARAVHLARTKRGLVIHGPPGTGKSQTIANIVGDHLARGERILFVCDKRTALDVVVNRLEGMGLGALCAIVHDPQRDQRDLYKSIREQLDTLSDLKTDASAEGQLARADAELQKIHNELTDYHASLMVRPDKDTNSFHELVGDWLGLPSHDVQLDSKTVEGAARSLVEEHAKVLGDLFDRASKVGFVSNPWSTAAAMRLDDLLLTPVVELRAELQRLELAAQEIDRTMDKQRKLPLANVSPAAAADWSALAADVEQLRTEVPAEFRARLLASSAGSIVEMLPSFHAVETDAQLLRGAVAEFEASFASTPANLSAEQIEGEIGWLTTFSQLVHRTAAGMRGEQAETLDATFHEIGQQIRKAVDSGYMSGAKANAAALPLDHFVVELASDSSRDTTDLLRLARTLDATANKSVLSFPSDVAVTDVGAARLQLAGDLEALFDRTPPAIRTRLAALDRGKLNAVIARLQAADPIATTIEIQPLDPSILLVVQSALPQPAAIESEKRQLGDYVDASKSLFGFLAFGKKAAARKVVAKYGLSLNPADIERCRLFLEGVKQRLTLRLTIADVLGEAAHAPTDADLVELRRSMRSVVAFLQKLYGDALLTDVAARSCDWLRGDAKTADWLDGLRASSARADVIGEFKSVLEASGAHAEGVRWLVGRAQAGRSCLLAARLWSMTRGADSSLEKARRQFALVRSALRLYETVQRVGREEDLRWNEASRLLASLHSKRRLGEVLSAIELKPSLTVLGDAIRQHLVDDVQTHEMIRALRAGAERMRALSTFHTAMAGKLLSADVQQSLIDEAAHDLPTATVLAALANRFDSLETVLRVREALATLPTALAGATLELVRQNVSSEIGLSVLRKATTSAEIMQRLRTDRRLMATDAQQLQSSFARYLELDATKKLLTRQAITHRWGAQQKQRLLASTGGRLNSLGADLRRRLLIRGERAMRLRQVVNVGQGIEGGDPLYDLRPVWMASPETVAQIFPRAPLFDVVIFDEASQCRLEEAMPVLLRAKRVVIAGDPKQLPPTRFFESAVAASEDVEAETDQQLFESQQGEIEDLLAAALNIEIEECYLDVHYRSRNSALIEFSNEKFYNKRLQAIPGHPKNRTRFAPLTLYKANGVYEKRSNVIEAERVVQIVRDLLKRAEPPTIGIACFNIAQKDLINEKLEEAALADPEFGRTLAVARERRTASSFEGLFVKNLENVQGDERDHIIISTTYGPDPKGRFYRRFGPVGSAGGGRRLNVLVTRARDEVHLVTSIPETVYRNLPPIPPGEAPGGAWLLFAYLVYAEQLAYLYEREHEAASQAKAASSPIVNERATRFPSAFAAHLARRLQSADEIGSDLYWGNDGFCMDLALHHPQRVEDVTVGVMCDMNRFEQAADPVEWEIFRTAILEGQGWKVSRVWTPHFFRDPSTGVQAIKRDVSSMLESDIDPDVLPVSS